MNATLSRVMISTAEIGLRHRCIRSLSELLLLSRRRWFLVAPVLALWALAYLRLFIDPTPRVPLLFNWTPSLPYRMAWMQSGTGEPKRGDLIVFTFVGDADARGAARFAGLRGQPLFKRVQGMPGDVITVRGRDVLVNELPVGVAMTHAHDRQPLTLIAPGRIPEGQFYVQGDSADSFDSRYRESGLVKQAQIIAIVRPVF